MFKKLRRALFTYIDVHSIEGCHRYYYLFGWEAVRFCYGCSHRVSRYVPYACPYSYLEVIEMP